jgi:hypothetical protein
LGLRFAKDLITKISQAATDAKQRLGFPSRNAGDPIKTFPVFLISLEILDSTSV